MPATGMNRPEIDAFIGRLESQHRNNLTGFKTNLDTQLDTAIEAVESLRSALQTDIEGTEPDWASENATTTRQNWLEWLSSDTQKISTLLADLKTAAADAVTSFDGNLTDAKEKVTRDKAVLDDWAATGG